MTTNTTMTINVLYATLANHNGNTFKMALKASELLTAKKCTAEDLAKVLLALAGSSRRVVIRGHYWQAPEQESFDFDDGSTIVINRGLWISHVSKEDKED